MFDAGRHRLDSGRFEPANDLVRLQDGGEVEVAWPFAEQQVANGAADEAGCALPGVERLQQPLDARSLEKGIRDRASLVESRSAAKD